MLNSQQIQILQYESIAKGQTLIFMVVNDFGVTLESETSISRIWPYFPIFTSYEIMAKYCWKLMPFNEILKYIIFLVNIKKRDIEWWFDIGPSTDG